MYGKRSYEALTDRVAKIDKGAAMYMRKHAPDLKDFVYDSELVCCFYWADTPQGHDFWENIYNKLKEEEM